MHSAPLCCYADLIVALQLPSAPNKKNVAPRSGRHQAVRHWGEKEEDWAADTVKVIVQ